jgi:FKBP-type peptidyl-prolyl cis-trans isomerase FklB
MKRIKFLILALPLAFIGCEGADNTTNMEETVKEEVNLESDNAKISYALGVQQIQGLMQQDLMKYMDADAYRAGFDAALNNDTLKVSMEEAYGILQKAALEPYMKNKEEGAAFLAENAKRAEVTQLPSGLQYEVIAEGNNDKPGLNDTFIAHYTGTLIDGTVFDSSEGKDPLKMKVGQVIPGWIEALQLMGVGAKWKIFMPYDLGYGERGSQGGPIEPFHALVFEMELLGVERE